MDSKTWRTRSSDWLTSGKKYVCYGLKLTLQPRTQGVEIESRIHRFGGVPRSNSKLARCILFSLLPSTTTSTHTPYGAPFCVWLGDVFIIKIQGTPKNFKGVLQSVFAHHVLLRDACRPHEFPPPNGVPFCVWLTGIFIIKKGHPPATPRFLANPLFLPRPPPLCLSSIFPTAFGSLSSPALTDHRVS